ncbi:MAG: transposase, partial [Candidatus Dormibacteraeota bacterium]|nr:transposase [Candidatus Dormibacteraeota bacterium]
DSAQREEFLGGLVVDAERLLELAREARGHLEEGSRAERRLLAAAQLLTQLLLQDVERKPEGGARIRRGTSAGRIPSVHDPEIRHGRKSERVRFDGHKLALAVDTDESLITAVDVMAGSAKDDEDALKLVMETAVAAGADVEVVIADAAYGSGERRREFADAGIELVARTPHLAERAYFSKARFEIDFEQGTCRCPAGQVTGERNSNGFWFPTRTCNACPLREQCYSPRSDRGREVAVHPEEQLLAQARALQRSPTWQPLWRRRQVVEHRIARMTQLGMRQARYRGRSRTLLQALLTATVANLTLLSSRPAGSMLPRHLPTSPPRPLRSFLRACLRLASHSHGHGQIAASYLSAGPLSPAFRPDS